MIWFNFATYVLVVENIKGTKALSRSKFFVKGYWWSVFWRSIVLGMLMGIIALVLGFIPIAGGIIGEVLLTPFTIVFGFLLYEDLKRLKEGRA